ncbi:hypothetical protein C9374_002222 [Naegleria lovaniensis]|uniref:Autophagy-related protein 11 n=1 Tax=Naegleria lovaniensis TaxID=51637 RepID=A0AA88GUD6_NAELO|nr:uncharacterized protein C9374_002222 [Naegleria lovaniensis]KAG2386478.1 hypothetical protein C9374_002222 [Naegleria lovaniensis]
MLQHRTIAQHHPPQQQLPLNEKGESSVGSTENGSTTTTTSTPLLGTPVINQHDPMYCAMTGKRLSDDAYEMTKSKQDRKFENNAFVLRNEVRGCYYFYDPTVNRQLMNDQEPTKTLSKKIIPLSGDVDDEHDTKKRISIKILHLQHCIEVIDDGFEKCHEAYESFSHRKEAMYICLYHLLNKKLPDLYERANLQQLEEIGEEFREFQKTYSSPEDIIQLLKSVKTDSTHSKDSFFSVTNEDERKIRDKYEVVTECLKIEKYIVKAVTSSEDKIKEVERSDDFKKVLQEYEVIFEVWEKVESWNDLKQSILSTIALAKTTTGDLQLSNYEITLDGFIEKAYQKFNLIESSHKELITLCSTCNAPLLNLMKHLHTLNMTLDTCLHSVNTYKEGVNLLRRLRFLSSLPKLYQIAMHEVVRRKQEFKKEKLENDTNSTIERMIWLNCQLENEKRDLFEAQVAKLATDSKHISELKKLVPGLIGERVNSKVLTTRLNHYMNTLIRSVDSELPNINQLEDIDFFVVSSPAHDKNSALTDTNIVPPSMMQSALVSDMTQSTFIQHVANKLPEVNRHIDEQLEHIKQVEKASLENTTRDDTKSNVTSTSTKDNLSPMQRKHQELSEFYAGLMQAASEITSTTFKSSGREVGLEAEILKLKSEIDSHKNKIDGLTFQLKQAETLHQEQLSLKTAAYNKLEREHDLLKKKFQDLTIQTNSYVDVINNQKKTISELGVKSEKVTQLEQQIDEYQRELNSLKEMRMKQGNEEFKQVTLQNDLYLKRVKQLEQQAHQSEQQIQTLREQYNQKIKEIQDKYDQASEASEIQLKVIKTLKDSVNNEKNKNKQLEQICLELKSEIDSLKQQVEQHKPSSSNNSNKKQGIDVGDRVQFIPVKYKNTTLWQANTPTPNHKYFLSPETVDALKSYYQENFQHQHTLIVNVIEVTPVKSMSEDENPYGLDFAHSLITGYIM